MTAFRDVASVVRTQNKGRNAYLLLLHFEKDGVFEEVRSKNPDLQYTDDAVWIGELKGGGCRWCLPLSLMMLRFY